MSSTHLSPVPDLDAVARAWHALSDEPVDGIPLDGEECRCRAMAPSVRRVLDLFYGNPLDEPEGLGTVVVNPLTGGVWVRAAHPSLPWYDPQADAAEQWADPTCEDWVTWERLPQPLVVVNPGWTPPFEYTPVTRMPEPTGIGAVVLDGVGDAWVRIYDGSEPWAKVDPEDGQVVDWDDLVTPIQVCTRGWTR